MQKRIRTSRMAMRTATAMAAALGLSIAGGVPVARATPPPPRAWDLQIDLYGWLTKTTLDMGMDAPVPAIEEDALQPLGAPPPVTVFKDDVTRHYDKGFLNSFSDFDGGGGGDIRFRYLRFVTLLDGAWVQADENSKGWYTNQIWDGKVGVRVLDLNPPREGAVAVDNGKHQFTLDVLAGARYRRAEPNVDIGPDGFEVRWHEDRDWVDGVVGLATSVGIVPNLSFSTVADIGGFGVGSSSALTWSLNPRLSYRVFDHLNLFIGWRYLHDNHDHDLSTSIMGPQLGLGYAF